VKDINREHLGAKCVTFAVIVVAFLCGWSATGLTGGVVVALALGAGTAAPIFSERRTDSGLRPIRRLRSARPK
jgi:hypothetical protein